MSARAWAIGAAGAAVLAVAAVAAVVAARPESGGTPAGGSPLVVTGTVSRQDLVVSDNVDGTLGYGGSYPIVGTSPGVLTWLPAVGQMISRGQDVYRVNGRPVTLWHGDTPFWRRLATGMSTGADVRELEQNLGALGYFAGKPDDRFTGATATAVRRWQKALGLDQTGAVDPGTVVVLPCDIRVTTVDGVLGAPAQNKLLQASGSGRVITVKMPVTKQAEATVGADVTITLPDGTHAPGTVNSVGTVATTPPDDRGADRTPTVDVLVTPKDPAALGKLDGAPVTVGFTSQRKNGVLTVPIEALLALVEGGYAVETSDGTLIKVDLGLFARGRVEVNGAGLTDGLKIKVANA